MNKKIIALCLIICVAFAGFVGCKAKQKMVSVAVTDENGVTVTDSDGKTVTEMKEAQTDKNGDAVTKKVTDSKGNVVTNSSGKPVTEYVADNSKTTTTKKSGSTTTTKASTTKAGSWNKNSDGTYSNGTVNASVVTYDGTTVAEGEELIKQMIEGALKNGKVISSKKTDKQVVYVASGEKITGSNTSLQFFKFQYITDGKNAYLVTYSASKEASLNGDFSYITDNLASLA